MPPPSILVSLGVFASLVLLAVGTPQEEPKGLGPGPAWRGPVRPSGANEVFATADGCAMCHSAAPRATALKTVDGSDISPFGLWRGTMMANAFRDPFWRAQVARESAADPAKAKEVQALCIRCHAPMAHHSAKLGGGPEPSIESLKGDALANDGVSCTVCHQIQPDGLGTAVTFSGQPKIGLERKIFGPYADPFGNPMRMHSSYDPTLGSHVRNAGLCGSCHTLFTEHTGQKFPEQTPFLEWENSVYVGTATTPAITCQDCHQPKLGKQRIARNPMGGDFRIPEREDYASHTFVGGNAFMAALFAEHRELLGAPAPTESFLAVAEATRAQLRTQTAAVRITTPERKDGMLVFSIEVENLTGHKFPTGYPARRAWLEVLVEAGEKVILHSGAFDAQGRLCDAESELASPHRTRIGFSRDVVVYELVAADRDGVPTSSLTQMATRKKDNRLLPRGYRKDGPWWKDTHPVGTDDDPDFVGGSDRVQVAIPAPPDGDPLRITVRLRYQAIPPAAVAPLRAVDADEARLFLSLYDPADKTPEIAGEASLVEGR